VRNFAKFRIHPTTETARASSVLDLHSLYVDPDPGFFVNAVPDPEPYPALKMNTDPDQGEMLPNIF
jgi:hypothetical protein